MFTQLCQKYHEIKKFNRNSIAFSLFQKLIKDAEKSKNKKGQIFIHNILTQTQKI